MMLEVAWASSREGSNGCPGGVKWGMEPRWSRSQASMEREAWRKARGQVQGREPEQGEAQSERETCRGMDSHRET